MYVLKFLTQVLSLCGVQNVKDDIFLKKLGAQIRLLRQQQKLTQTDLGAMIDNHGEQIGRIERGELNVSICTLKKIADGLHLPLKELLDF